jgi:predicted RNase H-related nuclease YkuK (DUF458 family)
MTSPLDTAGWFTLSGKPVGDIREKLRTYGHNKRYTLHIGTDTKPHTDCTTLITTICFREKAKGALVFYQKRKINTFNNVLDRLLHEAVVSLEVAESVRDFTPMLPTIHADVNPGPNNLSNRVTDAIIGMIKGMGYPILVKPEAWAADIADMYTR